MKKIRDEIRESPLFRFDWFFLSRTPVEIGRRCTTLLNTVSREFEAPDGKANGEGGKGRGRDRDEDDADEEEVEAPAKKKTKNGAVNKHIKAVKGSSKVTSTSTSRAASVSSTAPASKAKGRKK